MNIYWYTPYAHKGRHPLVLGMLRPEDTITVHSLATRFGVPVTGKLPDAYPVVRDLPEIPPAEAPAPRRVPALLASYWRRARLRSRRLRAGRYDVCHLQSLNPLTDGWALRGLARHAPLVSMVHDVVPHEADVPAWLEWRLLARVYRDAGTLVVYHKRLQQELTDKFDVDPSRVEIVPHPVREPEVTCGQDVPPSPEPTVLFFGALRHNKGIPVLLRAIESLDGTTAVRFHFAGAGPRDLEQLVLEAARRNPRITTELGHVSSERREELYRSAELVVLPYTAFASQSGVLADAYANRVPAIVTDVGALGDTVREDGTGWVVPAGDHEALAAAIGTALGDEAARRSAVQSIDAVATARRPQEVGRMLREIYERVANT